MKKIAIIAASMVAATGVWAQDAYDAAALASENLNGTARYVGMGGAMDALGADISTIGTNPAGLGLFRHSMGNFTLSVLTQEDAKKFSGVGKTNLSFDQIGFVWVNQLDAQSFVNFGFNYHKSNNFNQIIAASNRFAPSQRDEDGSGNLTNLKGSGQNLQTLVKGMRGLLDNSNDDSYSQVDALYTDLLTFNGIYYPLTAESFNFRQGRTGYIGEYDFSLSGNSRDRIYWGVTVGVHDVHYESFTHYTETLEAGQKLNGVPVSEINLKDERSITGQGFDIKAGLIIRPIEESPFRVGVSIHTPTWYSLKNSNVTYASVDIEESSREDYKFKYYTPWRFGVSLGHTIDNIRALGAGYEFTDYSSADMRYITSSGYSGDDSRSDAEMNEEIGACLKGIHTLKVGAELRPDPKLALRLGYNFVSPKYENNDVAYRNQKVNSPGVFYASTTDYTNWRATHRITAGVGTKIDKVSLDLAYQYSITQGDFFPFPDGEYYQNGDGSIRFENLAPATKIDFKRHQIMLTLGYSF